MKYYCFGIINTIKTRAITINDQAAPNIFVIALHKADPLGIKVKSTKIIQHHSSTICSFSIDVVRFTNLLPYPWRNRTLYTTLWMEARDDPDTMEKRNQSLALNVSRSPIP
jgi:5-methylcytosine-specific restriction endonuclease McrBC GTP-binding regulatory subunit McrB